MAEILWSAAVRESRDRVNSTLEPIRERANAAVTERIYMLQEDFRQNPARFFIVGGTAAAVAGGTAALLSTYVKKADDM